MPALTDNDLEMFDDVFYTDSSSSDGSEPSSPTSLRSGSDDGSELWKCRMEGLRKEFKDRLNSLRSRVEVSVGSVKGLFQPRSYSQKEGDRLLHLDFQKSVLRRRRNSINRKDIETWEAETDSPLRNISASLVVRSLFDGMFCAEVPLGQVPVGELILRERSNNLIMITKPLSPKTAVAKAFGYIELPIFVDPITLEFELATDTSDVLVVRGMMKGGQRRRQGSSRVPTRLTIRRSSGQTPLNSELRG